MHFFNHLSASAHQLLLFFNQLAFPSAADRPGAGTSRPQGNQRRHEVGKHATVHGASPWPQDTSGQQQFITQSLATARHRFTLYHSMLFFVGTHNFICLWLDLPQLAIGSYFISQCVFIGLITAFVDGSVCCHRLRFDL